MRKLTVTAGVACALLALVPSSAAPRSRIPLLDPNFSGFPDASLADYSDLLEPPAGRRGYCFAGSDGRLYFEDGTRARFWGVNVAKDSVFQPPEVIDQAVAAIARAGFNLVRLHHLDDENGLLPVRLAGSVNPIDPDRLDCVDHWIAALKARGIYTYLDLLDFRTFHAAEGVPHGEELGRGAKPYALFDERLIGAQMQYARQFLFGHTNPYTGLTNAQDPAVCTVELCDENGLFHEERRLGEIVSPYREQLVARWNSFLAARWGSRENLMRAWATDAGGALRMDEDPGAGTVGLPGVTEGAPESAGRLRERSAFFAAVHAEYFTWMTRFLRDGGLRCPITAVTQPRSLPDLWASATGLDAIAINHYFDHPYFRPESNWQLPAFISGESPLVAGPQEDFPGAVGAARVVGKPLIVREWGICWPNEHRAAGMLEALAYACLQDVDAMILFTLDTRPGSRKLDYFDVRWDPARWRMAPICGRAYLRRQVLPAEQVERVAYGPGTVFDPAFGTLPLAAHEKARVHRMETAFVGGSGTGPLADSLRGPAFLADTGEIVLDQSVPLLRVSTDRFAAVCGALDSAGPIVCGSVQFDADCTTGACAWQSLDGLPVGQSARWVVSVLSTARNTGQKVREHLRKPGQTILALDEAGEAPVVIPCSVGDGATTVRVGGKVLVRAFMRDGALELHRAGDIMYLHCSVPGVEVELPTAAGKGSVFYDADGRAMTCPAAGTRFHWPQGAVLLRIE